MKRFLLLFVVTLSLIAILSSCKDTATSPENQNTVSGVIIDVSNNPIAGAKVELISSESKVLSSIITKEDGKFTFSVSINDVESLKIKVTADGFQELIYTVAQFLKDNQKPNDLNILLSKLQEQDGCCNNTAKFIIKNAEGNPIKGAKILLRKGGSVKYEGTTNEDGKIGFESVCKGEYSVLVKYEGFVSQEFELGFDCEQTKEKEVTLQKNDDVCCNNIAKFFIKNAEGNAIKSAKVYLRKNGVTKYDGTADENGKINIDGICKGNYSVLVKYEGYASQEVELGFDCEQTIEKTVTLQKNNDVCCNNIAKLVIKNAEGNAIKGAKVYLRINGVTKYDGTADDNGKINIDGICKGNYSVLIKYEGYASQEVELGFDCEQTIEKTVTLQKNNDLCCNNVAKFTIKDAEGNPIKGAKVYLRVNGAVKYEGTSNENGFIGIDGICKGTYSILIKAESYASQELSLQFDCAQAIEKSLTMQKVADKCCNNSIKVLIKDSKSGNPVKNAKVSLWQNSKMIYYGYSDADGYAKIDNICEGKYGAQINYEGYKETEWSVEFSCNQQLSVEKTIVPKEQNNCCGTATFYIKDFNTGNPIKNAEVKITTGNTYKVLKTDENGKVKFTELCAGSYWIRIAYEGYNVLEEDFKVINCETPVEMTLKIKPKESGDCCNNQIKFVIKDAEGNLLSNVQIKITKAGSVVTTLTTQNGTASTDKNICKGEYGVRIYREGYKVVEYSIALNCEQILEHSKVLTKNEVCCTAWAKVLVFDSESKDALNGAKVKIWKEGQLINTLTVENGFVKFTNLCEGKYGFSISYDGYKGIEWNAEIGCNKENIYEKGLVKN